MPHLIISLIFSRAAFLAKIVEVFCVQIRSRMAQGVPSVVDLPPWSVTTTLLCSSPGTRRSVVLIYRYRQTSDV